VDLRLPREMGGEGGGTNPEELFAVGYAACFERALATVARRRRLVPGEVTLDSVVSRLPNGDGGFQLAREARCCFRRSTIGRRPPSSSDKPMR
jgi:osmotically inducible protein OsmC